MFDSVLIANRGEIACRIIATLRRLGIRSIAVYSDADASARHVHLADEAVRLGPAMAAQSYLDTGRVIAAARRTGAQAIHPGYGFLAENAAFARACEDAGIVFIGPRPDAIAVMGDKITAKLAVQERGVPTVPGIARAGLTDDELIAASSDVGYPLLIKPSAGGGGKGMHVVTGADGLAGALASARREAAASFGDDTLFLERYVQNPRHIEVQVLADAHGSVIHLGERECSLQRRHQKVIEEAPSPLLDAATRARIGEAACETARSVGYLGAGTVEFIVSADRPEEFFFMEMNTRLQVEHPVTEQVTGVDLVEQQLRIASGEGLALGQDDVRLSGHSIEARVYAEDPRAGFLPTGGRVASARHPSGDGIRVDTALEDGLDVSSDYDPMLAKIIAWGPDRDEARRRLVRALDETAVFGVTTNVEFLRLLLELPAVAAGDLDTGLIARELEGLAFAETQDATWAEAALLLDAVARSDEATDPWRRRDGWRLGQPAPRVYRLREEGGRTAVARICGTGESLSVRVDDGAAQRASVRLGERAQVVLDGVARSFPAFALPDEVEFTRDGATFRVRVVDADHGADDSADDQPHLDSPMPGAVVAVPVHQGARVEAGEAVVVVEAMKMEHVVRAAVAGTVDLHVQVGDQVSRGQTLATVTPHVE
ncbi:biotin carboxylase N-terminal domain-containing protein [Microbacterium sp. BK668]|uniref:acetyl/propionyl/methylcrotonyl-CoA carboxylase subunit alpha n=1 Tax=Microbacterium sp. BK668 TaxID=2512118 RepID=UPI0010604B01|nr:biotin carboxylase N-terminal domain-containing protein [Microbacterium sp. BK668]TDN92451.1 acetyl-CoA/propionyl-CoA carboxylase biotin carboxyl carrier protein [Microbacterium sp. BK668]